MGQAGGGGEGSFWVEALPNISYIGLQMSIVLDHCGLKSELHVSEARLFGIFVARSKTGKETGMFWYEIGSGFGGVPPWLKSRTDSTTELISLF